MEVKLDEFRHREGREPSPKERAALERQASADTRGRKSGLSVAELATRWQGEAAEVGWTVERLVEHVGRAVADSSPTDSLTVTEVVEAVSAQRSSWGRPDVIQAICDLQRPMSQISGRRSAAGRAWRRQVVERCVDLDPPDRRHRDLIVGRCGSSRGRRGSPPRRCSSRRSGLSAGRWMLKPEPRRRHAPSIGPASMRCRPTPLPRWPATIVSCWWSARPVRARLGCSPPPSTTCTPSIVPVLGVAPTAKAARVLERDTGMGADTVAKLLYEWHRPDRPPLPEYRIGRGAPRRRRGRDDSTPALHQLVSLAGANRWRLVLVGDHRQLQAVAVAACSPNCAPTAMSTNSNASTASPTTGRLPRHCNCDPGIPALDAHEAHDRIIPGNLRGPPRRDRRQVDRAPLRRRHRRPHRLHERSCRRHQRRRPSGPRRRRTRNEDRSAAIAGGEHAHVGDVVATRRNDRALITSAGETVRNRETWIVTAIRTDGSLTVTREPGHGTVTLSADYAHDHVRLGYTATEHGYRPTPSTTACPSSRR